MPRVETTFVLAGGEVVTVDPARPRARAVAVAGDRIVAVGDEREVRDRAGPRTMVVDLAGRVLVPGFVDAHVHPIHAGLRLLGCDLTELGSLAEARTAVASAVGARPDGWILGGGWAYEWFPAGCPSAAELDALVGGRAAYLVGRDGHTGWASSAALAAAGIGADTPDPPGGRIERLPDGRPQGSLHEEAMALVESVTPRVTPADIDRALALGVARLQRAGVTSFLDAWVTPDYHAAYVRAAGEGRLGATVVGALRWDRSRGLEQIDELEDLRAGSAGDYRAAAVKLMLDGVCESFTASLRAPYLDPSGEPTGNRGLDLIDPGALPAIVSALDEAGFACHFHAVGDAAAGHALDAVARARRENGRSGLPHTVAHLQLVDPADVPRFGTLGVVAACQPQWACADDAMTRLTAPFLGPERARRQYPFASLHRSGAVLAVGSDWPVSTPDVLSQLSVAVTRRCGTAGPFLPEEALDPGTALTAATSGSARACGLDRGVIRPGSVADLVILDRDPSTPGVGPPASVEVTMRAGRVVFERRSELGWRSPR